MANALYALGRGHFLDADIDWSAALMKNTITDAADYTINLATHEDIADVPAGGRVSTDTFASKTSTDGTADAADNVHSAVTGDVSELIILWYDSTVEATSWLIGAIDTATGLPVTPNGGDITIAWDAAGIFTL